MSASGAEDEGGDQGVQQTKWMAFDPTSHYPSPDIDHLFIKNWLDGRLQPLDRHVVPPATAVPIFTTRIRVLKSPPKDPKARYIKFDRLGDALVGTELVNKQYWDDPHKVYYKMRAKSPAVSPIERGYNRPRSSYFALQRQI
jgi:hypothetical protein